MPKEYAQKLRQCAILIMHCFASMKCRQASADAGTMWGFECYDVVPDLFCMGKGFSSSLPISGVVGRADVMDMYGPNEMTSTHSANPICCAAAFANINVIEKEKLVENAAEVGKTLKNELALIKKEFGGVSGFAPAEGLVGGLLMVKKERKNLIMI